MEKNPNELLLSPGGTVINSKLNTSSFMRDTPFVSPVSPTMPTAELHPGEVESEFRPTNRKKAILFQNIFLIFQFCYNTLSKWLTQQNMSLITVQVYERSVSFLICAFIVACTQCSNDPEMRIPLYVPQKDRKYLWGRCFVGITGSYSYLLAVKYLPISISMILFFTGPFWATIMGYFFLGELISLNEICAMCVAFSGVIIISTAKQVPEETTINVDGTTVETEEDTGMFLFGVAMAIIGALTFAAQSVIVRKMSKLNAFTITFWYTMCCSVTLLTASVIESCVQK